MDHSTPNLSDSEWEIMKLIWRTDSVTAGSIIDELREKTNWSPKTIKTLINRLLNKGVIGYHQKSREYLYYARVPENECMRRENKTFLNKVYDGALSTMLINFLKDHTLTESEIDELRKILDDRKCNE